MSKSACVWLSCKLLFQAAMMWYWNARLHLRVNYFVFIVMSIAVYFVANFLSPTRFNLFMQQKLMFGSKYMEGISLYNGEHKCMTINNYSFQPPRLLSIVAIDNESHHRRIYAYLLSMGSVKRVISLTNVPNSGIVSIYGIYCCS